MLSWKYEGGRGNSKEKGEPDLNQTHLLKQQQCISWEAMNGGGKVAKLSKGGAVFDSNSIGTLTYC